MRALKKFKLKKKLSYKKLHRYLVENGINVSFYGMVYWCLDFDSKYQTAINPKHIPKLIEITGYDFADFYRDIPMNEMYSDLAKAEKSIA